MADDVVRLPQQLLFARIGKWSDAVLPRAARPIGTDSMSRPVRDLCPRCCTMWARHPTRSAGALQFLVLLDHLPDDRGAAAGFLEDFQLLLGAGRAGQFRGSLQFALAVERFGSRGQQFDQPID